MSYTKDDNVYIGGAPAPGKRYVAGVGYVEATEPQGAYVAGVGYTAANQVGTWKCSCGTQNTGKFCQECGKPKPEPENLWTCTCGTKNTGKFCNECGKPKDAPKLETTSEKTAAPSDSKVNNETESAGLTAPANKVSTWTCPACGEENKSKFCLTCGAKAPEEFLADGVDNSAVEKVEPEVKVTPEVVERADEVQTEIAPTVKETAENQVEANLTEKEPTTTIANGWTCTACGEVNSTKFCLTCGAKASETFVKETAPKQKLAHIIQCPACGWIPQNQANAPKFCRECGSKLA